MKSKAFTLMELLIVVVIAGVTSLISVTYYQRYFERLRAENTQANLITIFNQERRYRLDYGSFYVCNPCTRDLLDANLGLDITDPYFTYTITATAAGYNAVARRTSGACAGQTLTITQAGSNVTKTCSQW